MTVVRRKVLPNNVGSVWAENAGLYNPSSKVMFVLFVSICSLTKVGGGGGKYDAGEAIASELTPRLAGKLLWRREQIRKLVRGTPDVIWQGVALPELEFDRHRRSCECSGCGTRGGRGRS